MEVDSNDPEAAARITTLPPEILQSIFQWLRPGDLPDVPLVCRAFHAVIRGNRQLFRDIYLLTLDTPREQDLDWEVEIHDLVKLLLICRREDAFEMKHELGFVYETVNRLLKHASPSGDATRTVAGKPILSKTHHSSRNALLLERIFHGDATCEAFLEQSFLFERVRNELQHPIRYRAQPNALHQQSAKLHCLYGRPILRVGRLRSNKTYPFACSKVYDLRQYTQHTRWGPFMDDDTDRVDWEKVEAILIVLGKNINMNQMVSVLFNEIWDSPFSGAWPNSYIETPPRDPSSLEARDPYGVTGTWYRIVCFLDYNDFFSYNFPDGDLVSADAPRPPLNVVEAMRLIVMQIRVTKIEEPGPDDGQALPVVHFRGTSRPLDDTWDDNANSGLRGTVRLTREGEVRWTTFSIFHGQERWRSEGVQIGGVGSARGVIGNWFDRDYDVHGPAGPTAFWKAAGSDLPDQHLHSYLPSHFYLAYSTLVDPGDTDEDEDADMEWVIEEEDEEDIDQEQVANELPGLLMDAALDIDEITHVVGQNVETTAHNDEYNGEHAAHDGQS